MCFEQTKLMAHILFYRLPFSCSLCSFFLFSAFVFSAQALAQTSQVFARVVPLAESVSEVYAPATGRIIAATPQPLTVGDKIKKGDPIAIIEHRYNLHDWVHLTTVRWDFLSTVLEARYALAKARVELEQAERLFALGSVSGQDVQALRAAEQAAQSAYDKSKALLDQQDAQIQQASLVRRGIFAPMTGDVSFVNFTQGQMVNEGFLLYRLTMLNQIGIAARIPESDRRALEGNLSIRVRFDNLPGKTFAGKLEAVPPIVDPESRVREVLFRVDNPGELLRFGMIGEAELVSP